MVIKNIDIYFFNQLKSINNERERLFNKIKRFQNRYRNGYLSESILKLCCDFKLLEEKSMEYKKQ